jgi:hypothetical protein
MSYWLSGKNSEGKKIITSSSSLDHGSGGSWLNCIIVAGLYTSILGLALCYILPRFFPDFSNMLESNLVIALFIFVPFCAFVWFFRPQKKKA